MNSPSQLISNARTQLERDATRLAGGLTDLSQRATVYHHLYEDSGKNHIFPLIAAHGALWAGGYFRFGMRLGQLCSLQFGFNSKKRRDALDALNSFADAFRDINRRVCIDTYVSYHLTKRFGNAYQLKEFLRPPILNALALVHDARENNRALTTQERKSVFKAHFLNEQDTIVGPAITTALEQFSWPVMKKASLSPVVRFAYLPRKLVFRDFSDTEERIRNGLSAFDMAAQVGWDRVEESLAEYGVLPREFFAGTAAHFKSLKQLILSTERLEGRSFVGC